MIETAEKTYGVLLPLADAAEVLGISVHTLRQWIQMGRIESHKLYGLRRVSEDELLRILEESRIPARSKTRSRLNLPGATRDRVVNR